MSQGLGNEPEGVSACFLPFAKTDKGGTPAQIYGFPFQVPFKYHANKRGGAAF